MSEALLTHSIMQSNALSALRLQLDNELTIARQHEELKAFAKLEGDQAMRLARKSLATGDLQVIELGLMSFGTTGLVPQ
jgi:hypothetical protein